MKITVGMGSIDDYIPFVQAGADEVFIGYVPEYINVFPAINRREVLFANVQIGPRSELQILSKMVKKYKVPVAITLNALSYTREQLPQMKRMILECVEDGFDTFIIADVHLLEYLEKEDILSKIKVHLSGEVGELNSYVLKYMEKYNIDRFIFHRKISLENMKHMMNDNHSFEAFVLNENCHFHGGYCHSLHHDALHPMCQVPYQMEKEIEVQDEYIECIGNSGCGICALWEMERCGIQYGKLVSRGNFAESTIEDIRVLKRALKIVSECSNEKEYVQKVKQEFFKQGCSKNCYYRNVQNGPFVKM